MEILIKDFLDKLFAHGGGLYLPHKDKIDDGYEFEWHLGKYDGIYWLGKSGIMGEEYLNLNDALNALEEKFNNIGAVQQYICGKLPELIDADWEDVRDEINKLVNEELERRKNE